MFDTNYKIHTVRPQEESRYYKGTQNTTRFRKMNYKNKWIQHVCRMDRSLLPNAVMKYKSEGKKNPGHPLKRLLDC
jgi:hypothetical protein